MYVNSTDQSMVKLAIEKSLLKEYETSEGRTVYLNDNDEFQIQLYNPTSEEIAAGISINDEDLSNLLVIRPGERIWLERYLDKAKKFKFSTYTVDDNVETENAIKNNGSIKVKFYKKQIKYTSISTYIPSYYTTINTDNIKYGSSTCTLENSTRSNKLYSSNISSTCADLSVEYNSAVNTVANCASGTASLSTQLLNLDAITAKAISESPLTTQINATIETGRISEGSNSNQKLKDVNIDFSTWAFKEENIKILPMSRKPYTSNDLEKIYCPECGRKLKPKYKFCPFCGNKIE